MLTTRPVARSMRIPKRGVTQFAVARGPSRTDAKRRVQGLQADFPLLIRPTSSNPVSGQQAALDRLSPHDLPGTGSGVSLRDCYFGYFSEREHPSKTSSPCRSVEPRALPGVFFVLELNATP